MEEETKEPAASRSQNVVYVLPRDRASIGLFLGPIVERLDEAAEGVQALVITDDEDTAANVVATAIGLIQDRSLRALAATSDRRAGRMLRDGKFQLVAGPASVLLSLARASALKTDAARVIALAWVDPTEDAPALEALMADAPRDAARTIITEEVTPELDALVERYARRARRVAAAPSADEMPRALQYLSTATLSRPTALRRLLDHLDPQDAVVYVRTDEGEGAARGIVQLLGYRDGGVTVSRGGGAPGTVILYDLPASREELREAAGPSARQIIALIPPRQMASLRALAAGGTVTPVVLPEAALRARGRDESMRAELRAVLEGGRFHRELLALEPLLDDHDGVEIAAAALRLLEQARTRAAEAPAPVAASATGGSGDRPRLFISVGARDNVRPGDLVGAITNEGGISSAELGRIEIRDSHSLVEIDGAVASRVASKINGGTIRGKRIVARLEADRPARAGGGRAGPGRDRPGGDRPPRDRGPGGPGGDRPRGPRPPRPDGAGPRAGGPRRDRE